MFFPDGCQADKCFKTTSGEIISPEFPLDYPDNLDKTWYIELPVGQKILLTFLEFDVEEGEECK